MILALIIIALLVAQGLGWSAKVGPVDFQPGWFGLAIWAWAALWP